MRLVVAPLIAAIAAALTHPPDVSLDSGLRLIGNDPLASVIQTAVANAERFGQRTSLPMKYGVFQGKSSLRDLPDSDASLLRPSTFGVYQSSNPTALNRAAAALLLIRGLGDAAHEVLLGVTPVNVEEAEHAATHPGQTTWADDHPLTTSADLLHAALHRVEGLAIGEGNHTGFENAKFWLVGGPKTLDHPASHHVRDALADHAKRFAPLCVAMGAVAGEGEDGQGSTHRVIVSGGGGKKRIVRVPPGHWDGIAFVDICRLRAEGKLTEVEKTEVADLQRNELILLLRAELIDAGFGGGNEADAPQ